MPRDETDEVTTLLAQISRNLEGLGEFRKRFNEVLEAVDARIEKLEKRIEGIQKGGVSVDLKPMMEERLKRIEEHSHKDLQESIENAINYTEELEKKFKEDNKFLEGTYNEMKEHESITDERLKEISKEINMISRENDKTNRFRTALRDFVKAIIGEGNG
jgi:DNA repair ATPase RecN